MKNSLHANAAYLKQIQIYNNPVSRIKAIGVEIPETLVDNQTITDMTDAPAAVKKVLPKLIYRMTKCKTRCYAAPGTSPSDLAAAAAKKALQDAKLQPSDIDTLIFASTDMDILEPATANILQQKIGLDLTNAFDVTNACNSFLQAINIANSLIASNAAERVLITSGEMGSYVCNRELKHIKELYFKMGGLTLGDAGAALVLEPSKGREGILEINLLSMGAYWELCHVPETIDWRQREGGIIHGWFYLDMPQLARVARVESKRYFKEYNRIRNRLNNDDSFLGNVDYVVPHQISRRFIEELCETLHYDISKVSITADIYGNTASTAIPIALKALIDQGKTTFGSGNEILLFGAASGFGIGHILVKL